MKRLLLAVLASLVLPATATAAPATQPPLDITKLAYKPIGHFQPGAALPANPGTACEAELQGLRKGEIFNPSGTWNAFDNNVFEVLCLPFRAPGDTTEDDPVGNGGAAIYGICGKPYDGSIYIQHVESGVCDNQQLEWIRYYEATMLEILGDFGATAHRYAFEVEDPGPIQSNTRFGRAINPAIVVPGADNPEETVIVGAHYDKTNDGPVSAWDSQEGHAEMIRMAKLMADYWRATGTRPSATVKFIPWDAEESGTFGSEDYANNNIVPGEEFKVRGYWNTDPCAGGYPSYRFGNPLDRIRMGIQLADPGAISGISAVDATRITEFNKRAPVILQQVLEHLDDTVPTLAGAMPVFLSDAEGDGDVGKLGGIAIGTDRPVLFSSDWRNFEVKGVPFFNPGPEVTGPNQNTDGSIDYGIDQTADAVTGFHSPLDNLQQIMRYTSPDVSGTTYSESYAKGMEFCSHLLTWGMLQHDQGGAQTAGKDAVAYYEALPNEAVEDQKVTFDAAGSHQLADAGSRAKVAESQLEYAWEFGDGETAKGKKVQHAYTSAGRYDSKLTVRNTKTGETDVAAIGITVVPNDVAPPVLDKPAASDEDGTFDLKFNYAGGKEGLKGYSVEESANAAVALDEHADSLNAWNASQDVPAGSAPWQLSSSDTAKYHGNFAFGDKGTSFWTGMPDGSDASGGGPSEGASILTLKEPVQLNRGGNVALSFQSSFTAASNDNARVQVAIDAPELEWVTVDTETTEELDQKELSATERLQGDDSGKVWRQRFVDLTKFAGRRIKLRFLLEYGANDGTFPLSRPGWYVDDIKLISGSFREIGQTSQPTFTVSGKKKGSYAYRIKAVFADEVKSSGSNVEAVQVTVGVPDTGRTCAAAAGFTKASVRGGRSLTFTTAATGSTVTATILRAGGRRLTRVFRTTSPSRFTKRLGKGYYVVRLSTKSLTGATDTRTFAFRRTNDRWVPMKAFTRKASCGLLSRYALGSPVFTSRGLGIKLATTQPARVSVAVFRGSSKRAVARFSRRTRANRTLSLRLRGARLRRGEYRVVVTAVRGKERVRSTLRARRI